MRSRINYLTLIFFFGIFAFFISCGNVSAASVDIVGKAKVLNTESYIDFNSSPYGSNVTLDTVTGVFSGFAFSEDLGWLAFGTQDNSSGPVALNFLTGSVSGLAKVVNTSNYLDFSGSESNVKISIPAGVFSGSAWSNDIGSIDFSDTGVISNTVLGYLVTNLPSAIVAGTTSNWTDNISVLPQNGVQEVGIRKVSNSTRIAKLAVDFTQTIDWSGLTADTQENTAFFHSSVSLHTLTNNQSDSFTLYIPKGDGDKVWICPEADSLESVTLSCSRGFYISEGQTLNGATAIINTEGGTVYWEISGLTGTGGMSVVTGLKDSLSRLAVSAASNHTITFGTNFGLVTGGTDTITVAFDPTNKSFDLESLTIDDLELTDNVGLTRTLGITAMEDVWGVVINKTDDVITFSVPTSGTGGYSPLSLIYIKIGNNASGGVNQIVNPGSVGMVQEKITLQNSIGEEGTAVIPIVDSDTVDITGTVTNYIEFDIDTGTGEIPGTDNVIDCASAGIGACLNYSGSNPADNYTVDLGQMSSLAVNKSNFASVIHSDGHSGVINSIYFDLTTNAPQGAIITVTSANDGLQGPGSSKIIPVTDGDNISPNSGLYGYNLPVASHLGYGAIVKNTSCDTGIKYCGPTTSPKIVFTTNNAQVELARIRMDVAVAAAYTNTPGNYTDILTFVATATF